MSRLSDLYKAMETLRNEGLSLNEDLERQVSELEEDIIKKEILPVEKGLAVASLIYLISVTRNSVHSQITTSLTLLPAQH